MLENWLKPSDIDILLPDELLPYQLGNKIMPYQEAVKDMQKVKIAIIGIGEASADTVRAALYQLSCPFRRTKVADLGNIRKDDVSFIIPVVKELVEGKVIPLIIGDKKELGKVQFEAYQSFQQQLSMCVVDETVPFHPRQKEPQFYLNSIVNKTDSDLFNLSMIGCQSHFVDNNALDALEELNFECIRLGTARRHIEELEPVVRDADFVNFNLSVLKNIELSAINGGTPSGFFSEEACQISWYAGMSDKLTSIGFYGYQKGFGDPLLSAKTAAQLIWYFIDGVSNRKNDFPVSTSGLTEYIVDFKSYNYQLTFWNSQKSNRWWMQIPVKTKKNQKRHRLIPCSYADYQKACNEELPDRLWKAQRRFGG